MTTHIASPCHTTDCPAIARRRGRCIDCQRTYERQRGNAIQRGYGPAWQRLRKLILARDPICRDESGCGASSTYVDHITSRRRGGTDDPSNLRGLCHSHHSSKTAREDSRWGRGRANINGLSIRRPRDMAAKSCIELKSFDG